MYRRIDGDAAVPVGRLVVEGKDRPVARFAYFDEYLGAVAREGYPLVWEGRNAVPEPIDPVGLPTRRRWFPSHPEQVHLAFHDVGPDGWGKGIYDQAFPGLRFGMAEYLALGGPDRQGDLAFGPDGSGPQTWRPGQPLFRLPDRDDDVEKLVLAVAAVDAQEARRDHLELLVRHSAAVGGARPKARIVHDGVEWIAKFPSWGDKFDEPRVEAACLDVAEAAGIAAPERRLMEVCGRSVLLLRRFDRTKAGDPLGYLSAGTLLKAPSTVYATNFTYADIAEVGRRIGAPGTAREMYRRFLLNAGLRNTDDHLRNHGFLRGSPVIASDPSAAGKAAAEGRWALSPVFDVVPQVAGVRHVCAPCAERSPAWTARPRGDFHRGFGLDDGEADEAAGPVREALARIGAFMDARGVKSGDRSLVLGSLRESDDACGGPPGGRGGRETSRCGGRGR